MPATASITITDQQKEQYREEGYFILENAVDPDMLQMLREECSYFLGYKDCELDQKGEQVEGITHKGKRYFIAGLYRKSLRLHRYIYSELMAEICRATLGDQANFFHEQWVVKGADQGMKFAWHQDSGYIKYGDPSVKHPPYLTCWTTLDDVDESNGTVYILPHSRGQTRGRIIDHVKQDTNDLVGYSGDDPGIPVIAPAGSVACFSSYTLHCSSANTTDRMRRVYVTQYTSKPIRRTDGTLWLQAVDFLDDGKIVYDRATDRA